jgi:hypothetical protein
VTFQCGGCEERVCPGLVPDSAHNQIPLSISTMGLVPGLWLSMFCSLSYAFVHPILHSMTGSSSHSSSLLYYKPVLPSADKIDIQLQNNNDPIKADIDDLIQEMPIAEKYTLLLQSYTNQILENSKDMALWNKLQDVCTSMLQKNILPTDKSVQNVLDAASAYCRIDIMSQALNILRKGVLAEYLYTRRCYYTYT